MICFVTDYFFCKITNLSFRF